MKQKLSIVIALINSPSILILDEPTNGMDPDGSIKVLKKIKQLAYKKNIKVLISSHKLEDIELICEKAIFLKDGTFIKELDLTSKNKYTSTVITTFNSDFQLALHTLKKKFEIKKVDELSSSIIISYQAIHSDVISELAKKNIFPKSIFNQKNTLRNTYFDINEGEK